MKGMKVTRLLDSPDMGNTYILGEEGEPCLIFDLGDNRHHKIEAYVARHHGKCLGVFLTHGHYDHIAGLNDLYPDWPAPIFIASEEEDFLYDPKLNASDTLFDDPLIASKDLPYYFFDDGDEISLGEVTVNCILTPFHTRGSTCFYLKEQGILFTGDTLFKGSIGRDDLPGALPRKTDDSLRKLLSLPKDTKIYPGHGPSSTLETELAINPFLRDLN